MHHCPKMLISKIYLKDHQLSIFLIHYIFFYQWFSEEAPSTLFSCMNIHQSNEEFIRLLVIFWPLVNVSTKMICYFPLLAVIFRDKLAILILNYLQVWTSTLVTQVLHFTWQHQTNLQWHRSTYLTTCVL